MDEIQRWLKASLETDPAQSAREDWFDNLPATPDALSFWLRVAVRMSRTEPWWYDTLVEYGRRCHESNARGATAQLPSVFVNWCVGVAANENDRPKRRGRPPNYMRNRFLCAAVEAYADPERGVAAVPHTRACGPAPALRAAWTARGQRLGVAHRLTTLAHLSTTNPTGPTAKMASLNKTALAQDGSQPVQRPTHRHATPNEPVRIIPANQENRLRKNVRKNGELLTE